MVNNYNLEAELLNKSRVVNRAPKTIIANAEKWHIPNFENCECSICLDK